MKMNLKIFLGVLLILAGAGFSFSAKAESPGYIYVATDNVFLTESSDAPREYDVMSKRLKISVPPSALKAGGRIQLTELGLTEDSSLATPSGYRLISPIFEYELKGTAFSSNTSRLSLQIDYDSDLEFNKFVMQYDLVKGLWREAQSTTDFEGKTASMQSGASRLIFAVFDTDNMTNGHASWYAYKKCMCAASPDYPKGTKLLVTNLNQGKSIVVTVNDWGPERDIFPLRVIDLDVVAFEKFGSRRIGVLTNIRVVPFIPEKFDKATVAALLEGEAVELGLTEVKVTEAPAVTSAPSVPAVPVQNISIFTSAADEARAAYLAYMKLKAAQ